jgi:hypothetical protein
MIRQRKGGGLGDKDKISKVMLLNLTKYGNIGVQIVVVLL